MNRRDLLLGGGAVLLLATALVRLAAPDRSRLRPISVATLKAQEAEVAPGDTATLESTWSPPTDVYVMGWNPWFGVPAGASFDAELLLYDGEAKAAVFVTGERGAAAGVVDVWREAHLPPGTGYPVRAGSSLTLRYRVTNSGTTAWTTRGATAIIYFVPVEGN
jgi:hypothetical protein